MSYYEKVDILAEFGLILHLVFATWVQQPDANITDTTFILFVSLFFYTLLLIFCHHFF